MALASGTRIGSYEVVGLLGTGGMGEVYRARDTKLNREVAIKVLPAFLASDPERLARFAREAQVLASLNHPNIAHVHGFEETAPLGSTGVGAAGALVMELVEGPTLADRIAAGPIPLDEAIAIARQLVAALDAAHAKGIVHRDLKPANIKVRDDDAVKVLDFGLAKLASADASSSGASLANSPTLTAHSTQLGMVVGTAAYMAPEQAKGKSVDKRADIWAFGAVLFEMITGRPLFDGETVSEVLANVLKDEPKWSELSPNTPPALRRVLSRCLEKDPRRRLHDIADALPDLDEAERGGPVGAKSEARGGGALTYGVAGVIVGALLTTLAFSIARPGPATGTSVSALSVLPPAGQPLVQDNVDAAISPDGRSVVFSAGLGRDRAQLWLRRLDSPVPRALTGTVRGFQPFWSPDGSRIGFFADGKLKTLRLDSGTVTELCDAPDPRGGSWSAAGQIVFQPSNGGPLMKVSADGGDPQPATTLDSARGETGHRFPVFLPDGHRFLYVALPGAHGQLDVIAGSVDDIRDRRVAMQSASGVVYASGYVIYERTNGAIVAQPFDPRGAATTGDPIALNAMVREVQSEWVGAPAVSVSAAGSLLDYAGGISRTHFVWFDATGKEAGTVAAPDGQYNQVAISPDGQRAATVRVESPVRSDIWILDLQRGGATRLTNGPGNNSGPTWSPDGTRLAFISDRNSQPEIYVKPADGSAAERQVTSDATPFKALGAWSKDGHSIIYSVLDPRTQRDIWIAPVDGGGAPRPYLQTSFNEVNPSLSPDGRWLSYLSDETGEIELYVQSFPDAGNKYRVTSGGVGSGGWFPDGRLAYVTAGSTDAYSVNVTEGPPFRTGPPQKLGGLPSGAISMDVAPDLKHTLAIVPVDRNVLVTLTVVQNWMQMLKSR